MTRTVEQSAMRKVYLRVLPFAVLTYFFCYLDRINVGFAALTMNRDLGLDPAMYGMAAGAFFWGYVLFEVPSNIILERLGARLWIARIMVTWGIVSGINAFATGPYSFMVIRFLLGLAEAGLFPGFVLYFTYWFPDAHRARINSGFTLALPIAVASGAPVSTALLGLNGLFGLRGWQIMFLFEAVPTVLIGIVAFFYMTDRPSVARWLDADEKAWLEQTIGGEQRRIEAHHGIGILRSFFDPKVLLLSLNYTGIVTASLGLLLFLPQIIKQLGVSNMQVGWITMIPYIFGAISMLVCGWISDRVGDRRWSLFITCVISTIGLVFAGMTVGSWWSLVGIIVAAIGFYGTKGPFWSMPTMFLTGPAAAAGIAWINSIGNLGGFFGPTIVGWAKQLTGSFAGGLYALSLCALVSAVVSLFGLNIRSNVRTTEPATILAE
ncbi:MAG TPA: MFS transporter [Stellaceae bacterium]|jgi:ACS family tartrate transporter-like MFS transporter|nr:MFS transporter [Stellaceae bacterium]